MMNVINIILGVPLGYVMYLCYKLLHNYGGAIVLFTLVSKVILFPLSMLVQKNAVRMAKVQPMLDDLKKRHAGDKDRIAEEQIKLYDSEKYSPAMGCLPTLLQIPLILGLINVIYNPLQHLLRFDKNVLVQLTERTGQIVGIENLGYSPQLRVIEVINTPKLLNYFDSLASTIPDFSQYIAQIQAFDLNFFGLNLTVVPSLSQITPELIFPLLSGLSALALCLSQNKWSVLQREQSTYAQWGMTAFMVVFSTYFTFLVPTGVALYWIVGNLSAIVVMHLCNIVYDPRKYIDYESRPKRVHQGKDERAKEKQRRVENHNREKADNRRFYADEDNVKQLVFYSAKSGFYKYFENTIDYILAHSDVVIHYVTSDEYDQIFEKNHPRIETYYIGYKALIPFMMKMDADMVVMTMPDLGKYYIKRSLVRKDVEYVYMFHGLASVHMTSRENAHDNFDTLLCVGQHQIDELRALEKEYSLKPRNLIPCGYGLIDNLIASYNAMEKQPLEKKRILVAPSWQQDNIMESCLGPLLEQLFLVDAQVVVRPHPEFIKRFPEKMNLILAQYQSHLSENFMIETDFSSNSSIFTADLLVTDWSGIAFEFSYATKKPSLFINTPMKVMNPEYKKIPLVPLDISLRDEVGVSVDLENIDNVSKIVYELLNHQQDYIERISALVEKNVFNIGHSGEAGGAYILEQLRVKREERKHADDSL